MKTENKILMQQARESLEGKWGLSAVTFLVYLLISGSIQVTSNVYESTGTKVSLNILSLIIGGPIALGIAIFSLAIVRNQKAKTSQIFEGFNNFGLAISAYFLQILLILLWMLLLIIPGIMAAISYSQTFFIIVDNPSIGAMEAIDKSKKMMDGYKWKYFCLLCRFIGWAFLCILTLGLGLLLLLPYIYVSLANFYEDIKNAEEQVG